MSIDTAKPAIESLLTQGKVVRPYLGVVIQDVNPALAARQGLPVGVLVREVTPGGPAEQAGVQAGDVIVAAGGAPVQSSRDLLAAIRAHRPGDSLPLTVVRQGARQELTATLGQRPSGS